VVPDFDNEVGRKWKTAPDKAVLVILVGQYFQPAGKR
jgi:hypothetical protein